MSKIRNFIFGVSFFLGLVTSFILAAGIDGWATQDQLVVLFVIALILFGVALAVNYKKLWKKLIDLELDSQQIQAKTNIAPSTFSKLRKNQYVSMDVLVRLCNCLNCQISDIVEVENVSSQLLNRKTNEDPQ